jgi:WS/DGAT/MGAT family acyltransferase
MSTRLSSADTAWLNMDRPTNLMVINTVLLFDQPVDWTRVKQVMQRRLVDRYQRFRQRVVESRMPLRPPSWEDDPHFSLAQHVHRVALPPPGDRAALEEFVGSLMAMPLDRNRPLWHAYMVDGYGDGAAMIIRMHHCMADGIALARVMLSLTDSEPTAGVAPAGHLLARPPRRVVVGGVPIPYTKQLASVVRVGSGVLRQGAQVATSPSHAARLAGAIVRDGSTALRLMLTPTDPASAIKGDPGVSRRVAWSTGLSLPDIKRIARANEATVNDVLLAAITGALRHYLQDRGSPVTEIQAMVPFNLRPLDRPVPRELGNKFGLVFVPLPVAVSGSYRRLIEIRKRMQEIKRSRDGAVSYRLLSVSGLTPKPLERRLVDVYSGKGTAVITNVPGPQELVYLAGTPVRSVLVWAPTSGQIGMSVSIFSYRDEVTVGLMVDAALIPDPERIVCQLEQELGVLGELEHRQRPARSGRERQRAHLASD